MLTQVPTSAPGLLEERFLFQVIEWRQQPLCASESPTIQLWNYPRVTRFSVSKVGWCSYLIPTLQTNHLSVHLESDLTVLLLPEAFKGSLLPTGGCISPSKAFKMAAEGDASGGGLWKQPLELCEALDLASFGSRLPWQDGKLCFLEGSEEGDWGDLELIYKATMNFQTSPERSSLEIRGSIVIIYFMDLLIPSPEQFSGISEDVRKLKQEGFLCIAQQPTNGTFETYPSSIPVEMGRDKMTQHLGILKEAALWFPEYFCA
ncbi:hypothetical protein E5288_WYG019962 [Bos mutus]|uniref:Uncharacterized protein n=1 Tax=Bos mutus TaxID=72004 RepID=A0A6B0RLY6_9CETA|nr:hypothetical protein [Bos mutus]